MDKLVATVVIVALALFLYLGVFQSGMGSDVTTHGDQISSQIEGSKTTLSNPDTNIESK